MAMNPNELAMICDLVRRRSGIDMDASKEYLIEARLLPVARKFATGSAAELMALLKKGNAEVERAVIDSMTTNETSFFRDITPFEMLKKTVLPDLIARRATEKRLSIWCAASSTGQEPYTIAMQLREYFPQLLSWNLTFVASDLSRDILARARAGRFSQLQIGRGLPANLLVKYFNKIGTEWEISRHLRDMIEFKEINLTEVWPSMPPLDLVLIRNVLIYFNAETKKQILSRIRYMMRPDGYLFLGVAESTMGVDDQFVRGQSDKSGCYQIKSVAKLAA